MDNSKQLFSSVPRVALFAKECENSQYTNHSSYCKDCYLSFNFTKSQRSHYSNFIINCEQCLDCQSTYDSINSYNLLHCVNCYNVCNSVFSSDCTESYFLYNCNNCQYCYMCFDLQNQKYCIHNKQYTKEEYQKYLQNT